MTIPTKDRPLVTFALFAYNQEKYIREAVEGALSQNYSPLEIILSDDCSNDSTFAIMKEIVATYNGPHKIRLKSNTQNLGLAAHVNTVMSIADGEIIIIAAGDDISSPQRTKESVETLKRHPRASSMLCSAILIDENGKNIGTRNIAGRNAKKEKEYTLDDLIKGPLITFGATRAIRKAVYDTFGPLNNDCPTEDTPFLIRSLILGSVVRSPDRFVLYRKHDRNLGSKESIKKLDLSSIQRQYEKDIQKANTKNLISVEVQKRLNFWAKKYIEMRTDAINAKKGKKELLQRAAKWSIRIAKKINPYKRVS